MVSEKGDKRIFRRLANEDSISAGIIYETWLIITWRTNEHAWYESYYLVRKLSQGKFFLAYLQVMHIPTSVFVDKEVLGGRNREYLYIGTFRNLYLLLALFLFENKYSNIFIQPCDHLSWFV